MWSGRGNSTTPPSAANYTGADIGAAASECLDGSIPSNRGVVPGGVDMFPGSSPGAGDMNTCKKCGEDNPREVREWTCECGCPVPSQCEKRSPLKFRPVCIKCFRADQRKRDAQKRTGLRGSRPKHRWTEEQKAALDPVDCERTALLDAAPIREWIRRQEGLDLNFEKLSKLVGVDETGIRRLMNGSYQTSKLDTVDRILCRMKSPDMLRELYPHLYVFTDEQMAEAEEWANGA